MTRDIFVGSMAFEEEAGAIADMIIRRGLLEEWQHLHVHYELPFATEKMIATVTDRYGLPKTLVRQTEDHLAKRISELRGPDRLLVEITITGTVEVWCEEDDMHGGPNMDDVDLSEADLEIESWDVIQRKREPLL